MMKKRGAGCVRPVVKTEYAVDDFAGRILLASDRAGSGLDCGDVNFRIFLPEIGRQAAECSASACHQNKGINTSVGILPDLRPGRADMCLRIGRVGCLIKKMEGRPHRRAVAADLFESCLTEWIKGGIRIGGSRNIAIIQKAAAECTENRSSLRSDAGFEKYFAVISSGNGHGSQRNPGIAACLFDDRIPG